MAASRQETSITAAEACRHQRALFPSPPVSPSTASCLISNTWWALQPSSHADYNQQPDVSNTHTQHARSRIAVLEHARLCSAGCCRAALAKPLACANCHVADRNSGPGASSRPLSAAVASALHIRNPLHPASPLALRRLHLFPCPHRPLPKIHASGNAHVLGFVP